MNYIFRCVNCHRDIERETPDTIPACPDCNMSTEYLSRGHLFPKAPGDVVVPALKSDKINHPPHYTAHPLGVECIDITEHHNFNVGNAIKYLWRAGLKDGAAHTEDLKKAAWYVDREIKRTTST